jgi:hypothetical protein
MAKLTTGVIVPENDSSSYVADYMRGPGKICEENMIAVEVVSKKYRFPELEEFQTVVQQCIYNDKVIYQHNTSQGLHISIGNERLKEMGGEFTKFWLSNFVNLWYKFERRLLALVPEYRSSVSPGSKRYSEFAVPLHEFFTSTQELNKAWHGVPGWVAYYVRDDFGRNPRGESPKYTAMNVKGLRETGQRKGPVTYTLDDDVFVEFRMLPATANPGLISAWITLLSCMSVICTNGEAWELADGAADLEGIFPPELEGIGQEAIATIKAARKTEVLYSYLAYEADGYGADSE